MLFTLNKGVPQLLFSKEKKVERQCIYIEVLVLLIR
jgi:hypothetical protein